ncbi:hypothetical protein OAF79_03220 [Akkermansiaceae bacterium]|jgi:hypothetical protein|nr:hypothetical protein [Akkermansiaceae bacterium]
MPQRQPVSCQWRLTTGPRAGQACGKGTKVFCGLHEPKATEGLRLISRGSSGLYSQYLKDNFSWPIETIIRNSNASSSDNSASWIWEPTEGVLHPIVTGNKLDALYFITNPNRVSTWLEEQLSKATIRNGQIFPESITEGQINSLRKLKWLFDKRKSLGRNFSGRRTRNPPMPFFQNSQGGGYGYAHSLQQVYNRGFTEFLQKYVCLMPDYIAVWNWFFLRFTSQVEETFNYYQEGFDMDAISNDLQELLRAYQSDLDEGYVPYTNRYRR